MCHVNAFQKYNRGIISLLINFHYIMFLQVAKKIFFPASSLSVFLLHDMSVLEMNI